MPIDMFATISEIMSTWNRPDAMDFAALMLKIAPCYQLLMESYEKAQSVQKNGCETKMDKQ